MEEIIEKLSTEQLEDITKFAAGLAINFYRALIQSKAYHQPSRLKRH